VYASVEGPVSAADLSTALNLPTVVALGRNQTEDESEQYPALIYRLDEPNIVLLFFSSDKLVITDTTEPIPTQTALTDLADQLTDFGLHNGGHSPTGDNETLHDESMTDASAIV
jgi:transcription initiation factor TFIID TATA-box-binding protein